MIHSSVFAKGLSRENNISHWNFFAISLQVPSRVWPHIATAVQLFLLIKMVKLDACGLYSHNITGLYCYDSLLFLKESLYNGCERGVKISDLL